MTRAGFGSLGLLAWMRALDCVRSFAALQGYRSNVGLTFEIKGLPLAVRWNDWFGVASFKATLDV